MYLNVLKLVISVTGVRGDDITLLLSQCTGLLILGQEDVVTEKLDEGNCSIYQG